MANCTSYARDIKPLFRQEDVDHMKPMDVHLDDYNWLSDPQGGSRKCGDQQKDYPDHANARWVQQALTGACGMRMPKDGPYWSDQQLACYQSWMDSGFQA